MYEVKNVRSKKELKKFIKMAWNIYRHNPQWVPPLIIDQLELLSKNKHPFHKHADVEYFMVYSNDEPVGRISALVNHIHNKIYNERTGFFGFFESIDDKEVANLLFESAERYLKEKGMERMRGPMNFSTNEDCGLLIDGFEFSPVVMMPYNPKYYENLFKNYGLKKIKELYAWQIKKEVVSPEKMRLMERIIRELSSDKRLRLRTVNMKEFPKEVERIKVIYNDAWSENWGFVPFTDEEFYHLAKKLKQVVDPRLVFIAEFEGEPIGFSLALPDINIALKKINGRLLPLGILKLISESKKIKNLRVITMGVRKGYRLRGIDAYFYYNTIKKGIEYGYNEAEMSWILDDNISMNRLLEHLGARIYKRYGIFEKSI
ncbi:MAG: N-acetyltransferase [Candidatus Aminicenantia bacterium]